ncbi:DNA-binding protein, partial [Acinetobacter baumannii]
RYRNKNNAEETWTGRGKQPRWLVAEIEKGAKLEDFLI